MIAHAPQASGRSYHLLRHARWLLAALPVVLLLLILIVSRDRWLPMRDVTVVRAVTLPAVVDHDLAVTSAGPQGTLFLATGWVEAAPHPQFASGQVHGRLDSVLVLEGETVTAGQVLGRIDDRSYRLAVERALATLERATAAAAEAAAHVATVDAELERLTSRIAAAMAVAAESRDRADRMSAAGQVVSAGQSRQAALRAEADAAQVEALRAERGVLQADHQAAVARQQTRAAEQAMAAIDLQQAELDLERCAIIAPMTGRIQALHKHPGAMIMPDADAAHAATLATIYDPNALQVRVDVPLADAAGLHIGQACSIGSGILPDRSWRGEVVRIEGAADLVRNTLQAKVAIREPAPQLRPEMLCRVEFLGRGGEPSQVGAGGAAVEVSLPAAVLAGDTGDETSVWVVDEQSRLQRLPIRLDRLDGDQRLVQGLPPGAWVVTGSTDGLQVGERVRVQGGQS